MLRGWLRAHNHDFIQIEAPQGLQNLDSAASLYQSKIAELTALISKPGTRKAKNAERKQLIQAHRKTLKLINRLIQGGAA
jgi:hypothetical protein